MICRIFRLVWNRLDEQRVSRWGSCLCRGYLEVAPLGKDRGRLISDPRISVRLSNIPPKPI